jgi:electron transport complex protein RnfB
MIGVFILTGIAFILALLLVFVDSKLNEPDLDIEKVIKLLPGYNCGSCGFGGCREMSHEILKDKENYKRCKPLRGENKKRMEEYLKEVE